MKRILLSASLLAVTATWPMIPASAEEKPFTMTSFAIGQEGSPIKFTAVRSTQEWVYNEVRVRNIGDKVIASVTLGMMFYPISQSGLVEMEKGVLIAGPPIATGGLQPQDEMTLTMHLISPSELRARRTKADWVGSYADLGVLRVGYQDGEFVFDAMANHGFRRTPIDLGPRAGLTARVGAARAPQARQMATFFATLHSLGRPVRHPTAAGIARATRHAYSA